MDSRDQLETMQILKSITSRILNNYKMKKGQFLFFVLAVFLIAFTSCKKDEILSDSGSKIEGTYNGTITVVGLATVPASTTLSKVSETIVNLIIVIGTDSIPLNGINLSRAGNNIYNLSDSYGFFVGKVEGNKLTWTLTAGGVVESFSGTK